jgi:glycosyltransferase involved in cell wall biosynthesis
MTVHDITALRLPLYMLGGRQRAVTKRIIDSIRPTDWLAFVSDHARNDFLDYKKHPEDRMRRIYNGVHTDVFRPPADQGFVDAVLERYGLSDRPYLMTLSSLAPHKNLSVIARAWPRVLQRIPQSRLLIAGGKSADTEALWVTTSRHASDGVIFAGFIPDAEFAALASKCSAFLFPSLYEGFGLPPLEAMACGAPVIASNRTAVQEVLAGAATLIDPEDTDAWVAAGESALAKSVSSACRRRSIEWASKFTWDQAASEYADLYQTALEVGE